MWLSAETFLIIVSLCSKAASTAGFSNNVGTNTFPAKSEQAFQCLRGGTSLGSLAVEEAISTANLELLSEKGRSCLTQLIEQDDGSQKHVYCDWPEPGTDDEGKRKLADQVRFPKAVISLLKKD